MKNNLILDTAHDLLKNLITKSDVIIDATMGNGYDTIFLASLAKHVYAFDIQEQAFIETKKKVESRQLSNVSLILDSHEHFNLYVPSFKGAVFNLGYLPNGDKSITTKKETTIGTIELMLSYLSDGGFIEIVVYPGHPEGLLESEALTSFLPKLNPTFYKVLKIQLPFQNNQPPYIYMIHKIKDESN